MATFFKRDPNKNYKSLNGDYNASEENPNPNKKFFISLGFLVLGLVLLVGVVLGGRWLWQEFNDDDGVVIKEETTIEEPKPAVVEEDEIQDGVVIQSDTPVAEPAVVDTGIADNPTHLLIALGGVIAVTLLASQLHKIVYERIR